MENHSGQQKGPSHGVPCMHVKWFHCIRVYLCTVSLHKLTCAMINGVSCLSLGRATPWTCACSSCWNVHNWHFPPALLFFAICVLASVCYCLASLVYISLKQFNICLGNVTVTFLLCRLLLIPSCRVAVKFVFFVNNITR